MLRASHRLVAVGATALLGAATWTGVRAGVPAVYEASPAAPVLSVETHDRDVVVNGRPAFVFGVWDPVDDWAVGALDANVLIDTEGGVADSVAGRAWILRQSRPGRALGPLLSNEIGVSFMDEPEHHGTSAADLAATPQDGRLSYENFQQQIALGGMVGDAGSRAAYAPYIANLGRNAAYGFDFYDWNWDSCTDPTVNPGNQYHYVLGTKWTAPRDAPIAVFIETTKLDGACDGELTPDFVAGEAEAAITAGATWINWWDRSREDAPNATSPEVAAAIRAFATQVHALAPILLAKQLPDRGRSFVSRYDDPVKVGIRTRNVAGTRAYDAILFNSSAQPLSVVRALPGLRGQQVLDVLRGTTTRARGGKLAVTIPAYDWTIQEYIPAHR